MEKLLDSKTAQAIVETITEAALILDEDLKVKFANEAFYSIFKVTPGQTERKRIYELGNKQWDIPRLRTLLEEILPKENSFDNYEIEHEFLHVGRKTMLLNARQLRHQKSKQPEVLLVIQDITDRKRLEKKLASYTTGLEKKVVAGSKRISLGKAREAAILESIGDGLIVLIEAEKGGKIIFVNKAFEDMMGWKTKEVLNKDIVDVIPREDKDGNAVAYRDRIMTKILAGEKVVADLNEPYYYLRKNKTKFPVASVITPIILNQKIIGAVETFRDITKETAADKTKTEFASLVSHQLRTPFSTVNWYLEMLLAGDAGKLNTKQRKYLKEIYRASKRMVDLVNVLLSISRIEMGVSALDTRPVDVVALAKEIVEERKRECRKKKVELSVAYEKGIPTVPADPKQVSMILQNLLSNSLKYTPSGGKISLTVKSEKGDVVVTVADTGMGIPKADQPNIFSRFFRASNAKAHEPEGIGLGLYILKAIIDQMDGSVWFKSQLGKGTTFFVALPAKRPTVESKVVK